MTKLSAALCFSLLTAVSAFAQIEADVTTFGATPNDNTDDTAAIQAALTAVAANPNGGLVRMPAGSFRINGRLMVGHQVDFRGAGMLATKLRCTTPTAGVSFQQVNPTQIPRGGMSGHFHIQGSNISLNPLFVGWTAVRMFERIRVDDAVEVGMKLEEVQNTFFVGVQVVKSGLENMTIDLSSRTLGFIECVFSQFGTDGVLIKQSGVPVNSGGPRNSKIHFYGGLIEATPLSSPTGACIAVTDGTDILIDSVSMSGGNSPANPAAGVANVRLERATTTPPGGNLPRIERVTLRNADMQPGTQRPGLRVKNGIATDPIQVFVESGTNFSGGSAAIETDDNALIHLVSYRKSPFIPLWINSGTKAQDEVIRDLGQYQAALTPANNSELGTVFNNQERENLVNVINNLRTRVNELEARLGLSGLIK